MVGEWLIEISHSDLLIFGLSIGDSDFAILVLMSFLLMYDRTILINVFEGQHFTLQNPAKEQYDFAEGLSG